MAYKPKFSKKSKKELSTMDARLQVIFWKALQVMDISVLSGYRNEEQQEKLFAAGASQLHYPDSDHNVEPSRAGDVAPYPIDWDDIERFEMLHRLIVLIAEYEGFKIGWGGDWKSFPDMPHYYIIESNS